MVTEIKNTDGQREFVGVIKADGLRLAIRSHSSAGDTLITVNDYTILLDGSANSVSATLPDATTCIGQIFKVKAVDISNSCELDTTGGQTIDGGAAPIAYTSANEVITIQSDGSNWQIV